VYDSEVSEFSLPIFPRDIDFLNASTRWSMSAELDESLNILLLPLEESFDAAIGKVAHPAADSEPVRLIRCLGSKEDTLNPTTHMHMSPGLHGESSPFPNPD